MDNFDGRSVKYMVFVIAIALIFLLVVGNAFRYLPENNPDGENKLSNSQNVEVAPDKEEELSTRNAPVKYEKNENESYDDEKILYNVKKIKTMKRDKYEGYKYEKNEDYDEADDIKELKSGETGNSVNNKLFENAKKLKSEKKYETAIVEYLNIADMSSNDEIKAQCYDEVATIYAVMKRYNQAIMYAQKSCNIKPTGERTILLSRIYYQAGQKIKAEEKIQAMLQKGFE